MSACACVDSTEYMRGDACVSKLAGLVLRPYTGQPRKVKNQETGSFRWAGHASYERLAGSGYIHTLVPVPVQ